MFSFNSTFVSSNIITFMLRQNCHLEPGWLPIGNGTGAKIDPHFMIPVCAAYGAVVPKFIPEKILGAKFFLQ